MLESRITALDAIAVPTAVEPKSRALISPTTTVAPSRIFNSAGVEVISEFVPGLPAKAATQPSSAEAPRSDKYYL